VHAATDLAERKGLSALTVDAITKAAGHAKGTFYVHFSDRTELLIEMHRRFHDELFDRIAASVERDADGPARVRASITAFLEGCRGQVVVRAMLFQARHEPVIADLAQQRNEQAAKALASDLRGSTSTPDETARLLVTATVEVAIQELTSGRRLPRLRSALLAMVPS